MRIRTGMLRYGLLLTCTAVATLASVYQSTNADEDKSMSAAGTLKTGIQQHRKNSPSAFDGLKQAATKARQILEDGHYAQELIDDALNQSDNVSTSEKASVLRAELKRVHESLTFKPTMEAKLPRGYPPPTPVHKIEIKQLPAYRMAVAEMQGKNRENSAFFELFNHIKRNDIAMTAPVEMEYSSEGVDQGEASMAFLYREPELGKTGVDPVDDDVTVVDVPAMTVVSIGVRGRCDDAAVKQAETRLRNWLDDNKQYKACGELRRLGYNSPMIPSFMKYSEVQLPVCKTEAE